MQEITWKCYSPLTADFFLQEVYDDPDLMDREGPIELDGADLAEYADPIHEAIQKENNRDRDLAQYIRGDAAAVLNDKVQSIIVSAELAEGTLLGCATVKLCEPLNDLETEALKSYLTSQYSDAWGEGFEQREIAVGDGVLFVHFWNSGQFSIEIDRHPDMEPQKVTTQESAVCPHPKMDLVGEDGNIFAILGRASRLLCRAGQADRAKEMTERVTASHSYNEALFIVSEYVETELSRPERPAPKPKTKGGDAR